MEYGCIAEHLGHSFSKEIHKLLADYPYELCELAPDEVESFLHQRDFRGINVTIPYKQTVIPYLDELSPIARDIGAVNTIVNRGGKLYGDNTDFWGLKCLLEREKIDINGKNVLILGTGGTSRTARAVAAHMGANRIGLVSRSNHSAYLSYEAAKKTFCDAQVLINTTPVGMYPTQNAMPYQIELEEFPHLESVVDVIYHPLRSNLVLEAKSRGLRACGGLTMLVMQAAEAAARFLDMPLPADRIWTAHRSMCMSKENIVLIGMPGSGKSSIGKLLAKKYHREFLDTDQVVHAMTGKKPSSLLNENGEEAFRELEKMAVRLVASGNGLVVATGGGAVLQQENIQSLRRNGRLIFLDRPPELLPIGQDRPLSSSREQLMQRYRERIDLYRGAADATIYVKGDVFATAEQVAKAFENLFDWEGNGDVNNATGA